MGIPIDTLATAGDSLYFRIRAIGGEYAGRRNAAGDTLLGSWRQAGTSFLLDLSRGKSVVALRRPQLPRPPYPYDTLAVAFASPFAEGVRLSGTLTLPLGEGPFPCALLISGSGQQDRDETLFDHRPFKVLADHLTRRGIAVLRVDDRGVGGSTGPLDMATSEDFVGDAQAGLRFLLGEPRIDSRRIGLIGHSEGGIIAPMVASRWPDLAFMILLASPGLPGDTLAVLQSTSLLAGMAIDDAVRERIQLASQRLVEASKRGDSLQMAVAARGTIEAQMAAAGASGTSARDMDAMVERTMRQMRLPWMRFFLNYDPATDLKRVSCPVLALTGERDVQVLADPNLAGLEAALRAGGNRDVTTAKLPGLNHLFQTCETGALSEYAQIEETMAPVALARISDWLKPRVSAPRKR